MAEFENKQGSESRSRGLKGTKHLRGKQGGDDDTSLHTEGIHSISIRPNEAVTASAIIASFHMDPEQCIASVVIPPGVTNLDAMHALNVRFQRDCPSFARDAIHARDFRLYSQLDPTADSSAPRARDILIHPLVPGSLGRVGPEQDKFLRSQGLNFASPSEQAIIAAAYACRHAGADIFRGYWARGAVADLVIRFEGSQGIKLDLAPDLTIGFVGASARAKRLA